MKDLESSTFIKKVGLLDGVIALFQRPFPIMEDWQMRWIVIGFHGLFAALFLIIFQPFKDVFFVGSPFINVGFGIVVSLVLAFNHFLISKILPFDLKKWTIGKSIAWTLYDVLTVIIGVFIYKNYWADFESFTWQELWKITYSTLFLAIIPVIISTIATENWLLRRNLKRAYRLQKSLEEQPALPKISEEDTSTILTLYSNNKNEWVKLHPHNLILLESSDNYVKVYYRENNEPQKKLLRATLAKVEDQILDIPFIFRCHRSYIINLNQIRQIDGNSRGLQIELIGIDQKIPVSRKYVKTIQEQLSTP